MRVAVDVASDRVDILSALIRLKLEGEFKIVLYAVEHCPVDAYTMGDLASPRATRVGHIYSPQPDFTGTLFIVQIDRNWIDAHGVKLWSVKTPV